MGKWRQRLCSPFVRVQEPINSSEKLRSISVEDISTSAGSEKPLSQAILTQTVLLLRQIKGRYELVDNYALPEIRKAGEVIVRTAVIGLNPIDWKAPYVSLLRGRFGLTLAVTTTLAFPSCPTSLAAKWWERLLKARPQTAAPGWVTESVSGYPNLQRH